MTLGLVSGTASDGVYRGSGRLPVGSWKVVFSATVGQGKSPMLAGPTVKVTAAVASTPKPAPTPPPAAPAPVVPPPPAPIPPTAAIVPPPAPAPPAPKRRPGRLSQSEGIGGGGRKKGEPYRVFRGTERQGDPRSDWGSAATTLQPDARRRGGHRPHRRVLVPDRRPSSQRTGPGGDPRGGCSHPAASTPVPAPWAADSQLDDEPIGTVDYLPLGAGEAIGTPPPKQPREQRTNPHAARIQVARNSREMYGR